MFLVALLILVPAAVCAVDLPAAQSFSAPVDPSCGLIGGLGGWSEAQLPSLGFLPLLAAVELLDHIVPHERQRETPIQLMFTVPAVLWDAAAPYNDTAKPALAAAAVPRQPAAARTNTNINTAMIYATLRLVDALLPAAVPAIRGMMTRLGLNPDDASKDTSTPVGIGNTVGTAWAQFAANSNGMNVLGNREHARNRRPYSDYTSFVPANDAYRLTSLTKWQPLFETNDLGYFTIQTHIAPQTGRAKPFSLTANDVRQARAPAPYPAEQQPSAATLAFMRNATDQVLAASAALTDRQKVTAEFYDDKLASLGAIPFLYGFLTGSDIHTTLGSALAVVAVFDATIIAWKEKVRHAAVRPASLVRHFYGDSLVTAYGGRYVGTTQISGNEWNSYLRTMPHADYPSGTSCVCAAFGSFMASFLKTDTFKPSLKFTYKKGCSRREPGATPAAPVTITVSSITSMLQECSLSRLHAGVHFQHSIDAGQKLCGFVGLKTHAWYTQLRG